jgi:formate-dependent phosphoribosylglycinamide formyltransferase (GAR transformylase)
MDVLLISPGFPPEMPYFTRGLAEVGARVLAIGDQPKDALEPEVREALTAYHRVGNLWDEEAVVEEVLRELGTRTVDRVECLWEPAMILAGRLRDRLGVPGLSAEQARVFRDKESMKATLDAAGIRTPHHYRARTAHEVREAVERIGYPVIVKPIAGAGSADTYWAHDEGELSGVLERVRHVPEVSVEEFVQGEEHTYDTVSADGEVLFENVAWYRPTPLVARLNEWISPQAVCLRDLAAPELRGGIEMGRRALRALGFERGFAHMEWFRKPDGEVVFGEIGGRPPGGRLVHVMNFTCDCDLFVGWAEAVCHGRISQDLTRRYNAGITFKRARGSGSVITRIEGLERLRAALGEHLAAIELTPPGRPRVDWRQVVSGDGWVVVRHPELGPTLSMADRVGSELELHAD